MTSNCPIVNIAELVQAIKDAYHQVIIDVNRTFNLEPDSGGMLWIIDTLSGTSENMTIGWLFAGYRASRLEYSRYSAEWLYRNPDELTSMPSGSRVNAIRAGRFIIALTGRDQKADQEILVRLAERLQLIDKDTAQTMRDMFNPSKAKQTDMSPGQRLAERYLNGATGDD